MKTTTICLDKMTASSTSSIINLEVKETAELTWTIERFRKSQYDHVSSPDRFSAPNSKDQFLLYLHLSKQLFDFKSVYVCLWYNGNQTQLPMQYRVAILDSNGLKQYTREYLWNYSYSAHYDCNSNVTSFISHDKCKQFLVDGGLKIYCEVDILKCKEPPILNTLLENSQFSDFTLVVGSREFRVHRAILAARSKAFRALFIAEEEKKTNRFEVSGIDPDMFEELLCYLYTEQIPNLSKYASELLMTADKYELDHLKSKCIDYITSNSALVMATDGWKTLRNNKTDLVAELFENMIIGGKKY